MPLDEPLTPEQEGDIAEELGGKLFRPSAWFAWTSAEDHSFCQVCWDRIDSTTPSAYVTADHEVAWVCANCFAQQRSRFSWHLISE